MATRVALLMLFAMAMTATVLASRFDHRMGSSIVGGWKPIDPSDPDVQSIAKFAVSEHNKKLHGSKKLEYSRVVDAKRQVVQGVMYDLELEVFGGSNKLWEARVWVKEWENFKKLMEFKPLEY